MEDRAHEQEAKRKHNLEFHQHVLEAIEAGIRKTLINEAIREWLAHLSDETKAAIDAEVVRIKESFLAAHPDVDEYSHNALIDRFVQLSGKRRDPILNRCEENIREAILALTIRLPKPT
jgi:hypothetical protein